MVLVCAVVGSLAAGVLLAYGVCLGMFALFHMHVRAMAAGKLAVKPATQSAQS